MDSSGSSVQPPRPPPRIRSNTTPLTAEVTPDPTASVGQRHGESRVDIKGASVERRHARIFKASSVHLLPRERFTAVRYAHRVTSSRGH